jgi:hypothetical protein
MAALAGPAIILNTASKASTTGGTFADTLTANSGDSLSIPLTNDSENYIFKMWGMDSLHVAELALTDTRSDSIHDPQFGVRFNISALAPGAAGTNGSRTLLSGPTNIQVFPGDTLTQTVTTTAADGMLVSWLTKYNSLPGVSGNFATWDQIKPLRDTTIGVRCAPVASGTVGAYGTTRAINADDPRWTGGKYYAILGWTQQLVCTTVAFSGQAWGNNKIGGPGGVLTLDTTNYFVDLNHETGIPCIPIFNGYDAGNVFLSVADDAASTTPKIDIWAYELSRSPFGG